MIEIPTNLALLCSLFRNLASKNLPAAIEDTGGNAVPDSIKEKSQGIREQGGIQSLEDKLYSLPELLTRNREILDEVCYIIYTCTIVYTCTCTCIYNIYTIAEPFGLIIHKNSNFDYNHLKIS